MCHTPPGESCPRCLEWIWDPGPTSGNPDQLGPAEALARWPPHAHPVWPRLWESSPRPAPHSPLTLARAAEPGSGIPCGCRMPSGRARRGDQVPGYSRALEAAEDTAGGRGAPPFVQPVRRARSPKKVWRSKGWRRGGRRGRFPALPRPALPVAADRSHGRAPPTGEARIGLYCRCSAAWDWSQEAGWPR